MFNKIILSIFLCFVSSPLFAKIETPKSSNYLVLFNQDPSKIKSNWPKSQIKNYLMTVTKQNSALLLNQIPMLREQVPTDLWLLQGTILRLDQKILPQLKSNSIVRTIVPLNRKGHLVDPIDGQQVRVDKYTYGLQKLNFPKLVEIYPEITGQGITVGIIDTGIEQNHKVLSDKKMTFKDFISNNAVPYDDQGHGTHVAGTISGTATVNDIVGLAPKVSLLVAKAFSKYGGSEDKDLLLAMQWVADPDQNPNTDDSADILSCSWNVDAILKNENPEDEPFCLAVDQLQKLGIYSVFAAGNDGPDSSTILAPGACANAITVAATDSQDKLADFSSKGPIKWKSTTTPKPDIAAPGVDIYSSYPGNSFRYKSGTSMATPHIAGALALILQASKTNPLINPKEILLSSTLDLGPSGFDTSYGNGRLDVLAAIQKIKKQSSGF